MGEMQGGGEEEEEEEGGRRSTDEASNGWLPSAVPPVSADSRAPFFLPANPAGRIGRPTLTASSSARIDRRERDELIYYSAKRASRNEKGRYEREARGGLARGRR